MTINQLPTITIAAGDTQSIQVNYIDSSKKAVDVSSSTVYLVLSPFGFEDENVLSLEMNKVSGTNNKFKTTLYSEDTIDLLGTYTMKIVLIDSDGNYFKKARGILNVLKDSDGVEVSE